MVSMKSALAAAAFVLVTPGAVLVSAPTASAVGTSTSTTNVSVAAAAHHKCTKTSSGHCIKGGQFCPKAKYHKSGWDAQNRRYVCKGSKSHPHWMKP